MPSIDDGAEARRKRARNCSPWVRSLVHSPEAVIHSPAEIVAAWPTAVTRSRWPRALIRSTQKPVSGLWKVTRSTRPASTSRPGAVVALTCGPCRPWGGAFQVVADRPRGGPGRARRLPSFRRGASASQSCGLARDRQAAVGISDGGGQQQRLSDIAVAARPRQPEVAGAERVAQTKPRHVSVDRLFEQMFKVAPKARAGPARRCGLRSGRSASDQRVGAEPLDRRRGRQDGLGRSPAA